MLNDEWARVKIPGGGAGCAEEERAGKNGKEYGGERKMLAASEYKEGKKCDAGNRNREYTRMHEENGRLTQARGTRRRNGREISGGKGSIFWCWSCFDQLPCFFGGSQPLPAELTQLGWKHLTSYQKSN